jgi:hypothetical protein
MRTIDIKSITTGKIVARYHYWNSEQVKKFAADALPSGEYLLQSTNSMASKPRISKKSWESAEKFTVAEAIANQ